MVAARPTRARIGVLGLLFGCVVIAFMDRANLSVAGSAIQKDLGLSPVALGYVFSAFSWTYAALQIPGGWLANFLRPRPLYTLSLALWSGATALQGWATGFATLFGLRVATGAFQAPAYPINNRVVTSWFPDHERASAIALYTSGQYVGLAVLTPVMAWLVTWLGWRSVFFASGFVGLFWSVVFFWRYRDPSAHARVSHAELDEIWRGGAMVEPDAHASSPAAFSWHDLKQVFRYRKLWGIYLGQFSVASTSWFFLTWFPTYLERYRGIALAKTGWLAAVPFLAASWCRSPSATSSKAAALRQPWFSSEDSRFWVSPPTSFWSERSSA